jgi:hypothetical protein
MKSCSDGPVVQNVGKALTKVKDKREIIEGFISNSECKRWLGTGQHNATN